MERSIALGHDCPLISGPRAAKRRSNVTNRDYRVAKSVGSASYISGTLRCSTGNSASALPALEAATKDDDEGVRAAAVEAVKKIKG